MDLLLARPGGNATANGAVLAVSAVHAIPQRTRQAAFPSAWNAAWGLPNRIMCPAILSTYLARVVPYFVLTSIFFGITAGDFSR
jgi:hypothetical protein